MLLTIFLKHQQETPLGEIDEKLRKNGFWRNFPPEGVEVVTYYVMMGIGQVVTLRLPGHRLREVSLAVEKSAWGAFRTELHATCDFMPVLEADKARQGRRAGGAGSPRSRVSGGRPRLSGRSRGVGARAGGGPASATGSSPCPRSGA